MLLKLDATALVFAFDRKILHKIFGTVRVRHDFCIVTSKKLYDIFKDMDVE